MKTGILTLLIVVLGLAPAMAEGDTSVLVFYGVDQADDPEGVYPIKILRAEDCEITPDTVWLTKNGEQWPFARSKVQMILRAGMDPAPALEKFPELAGEIRKATAQWGDRTVEYVMPPGTKLPMEESLRVITTREGQRFEGITGLSRDPDGLSLKSATGIAKVPFEQLPPELVEKFQFDIGLAQAYRQEQRQARLALAQAKAEKAVRQREMLRKIEQRRAEEKKREDWETAAVQAKWKILRQMGPRGVVIEMRLGKKKDVDWNSAESFVTLREEAKKTVYEGPEMYGMLVGGGVARTTIEGEMTGKLYPVKATFFWRTCPGGPQAINVYAANLETAMAVSEEFARTGKLNFH